MGWHVKRSYLIDLINQSYIDQEKNCRYCYFLFCQRTQNLEGEL